MLDMKNPNPVIKYVKAIGGKARLSKELFKIGAGAHPQTIYRWMELGRIPANYKPFLELLVEKNKLPIKPEIKEGFLNSVEAYSLYALDEKYPDTDFTREVKDLGYEGDKSIALGYINAALIDLREDCITFLELYHWMRAGDVTNLYKKPMIYKILKIPASTKETPKETIEDEYKDILG